LKRILLKNGVEIVHFQTGTVVVRPAHREYLGPSPLRFPRILLSRQWTADHPISVWLIKSEQGSFLIDTGENIDVFADEYFGSDRAAAFIKRRILKLNVTEAEQIDAQLQLIGMSTRDIDAIINAPAS
jgi:glyoxylase-like metal-dependent hydrolase (beta-lactamase superfamily II)